MRWPLEKIYVTQKWGNDLVIDGVHIYAKWGYKGHNGIDLWASNGTPVYAPHDGVVKERRLDADGYGNYLKIENEVEGSILAHLRDFNVNVNKLLKEGDLIGWADNTGASTGPHLHHGYYRFPRDKNNGYGGTIDQTPFINNQGGGSMPSDDGALQECLNQHTELVTKLDKLNQQYNLLQEVISNKNNEINGLKQDNDRVRDEMIKQRDDMTVRINAAETGLKAEKEAKNEIIRMLSNELGTTQNVSEIKAIIVKLVGVVDLLSKERQAHNATKDKLTDRDIAIKQLENEIQRLQGDLKKAKSLGDATSVELLQELIERLKKLIRR